MDYDPHKSLAEQKYFQGLTRIVEMSVNLTSSARINFLDGTAVI